MMASAMLACAASTKLGSLTVQPARRDNDEDVIAILERRIREAEVALNNTLAKGIYTNPYIGYEVLHVPYNRPKVFT